jgi:hypothetical protein
MMVLSLIKAITVRDELCDESLDVLCSLTEPTKLRLRMATVRPAL